MGNKRIYLGSETSKYAKLIGIPIVSIISLFVVLQMMGFEITGSDMRCMGTLENPCVSYGQICNYGADNFDIYKYIEDNPKLVNFNKFDLFMYWLNYGKNIN